ncbi:MAG TPA: SCO family protein [Mycobacteriales bacterium]|nr:SCO family protein [Mycobacteriales bacterium]
MRRAVALLVGVVLAGTLAGCGGAGTPPAAPAVLSAAPTPEGTYRGTELDPPQPRPTFTLTDTTGARFDFAARTRGRPTLLFFGFTHCPDVCPTTMASVAAALRGIDEPLRGSVQVVLVTTDPARDTGPVLARWLRSFDADLPARFVGLTGTVAQVEAAQAAARVPVAEDGGRAHSTQLLLYGADDYARVTYLADAAPDDLRHDLPLVAKGA